MNLKALFGRLKNPVFRSKLDSRFGLGKLEKLIFTNWFNPFLTFWINFRSLPFSQAIFMPIWVYGRPRLYCLSGRIQILGKIKTGLIKFNIVKIGAPGNMSLSSELYNLGTIIFGGKCEIGTGNKIVVGSKANLCMGDNSVIMDHCSIAVHENVDIGNNTTIAHNCQIFDTNFHFVANLDTKLIPKRTEKVSIGSGCWICNSVSVMKGAIIPDYAIIGSHSLVNKNFSMYQDGCIIAGNPSKVIKQNCVRVFNSKIEDEIWKYWRTAKADVFPIENIAIEDLVKYV